MTDHDPRYPGAADEPASEELPDTSSGTPAEAPSGTPAQTPAAPPAAGLAVPDLTIVPMRRRHLRSIVRIQAADPHLGWSVGLWLAELRREGDRSYVVAQVGRETVGYAGILLQDEDAHITTIGVAPSWQGHRIGTRMLLQLVGEARRRGALHLTLEVRASNTTAIALYRRFGMAPAGIRKNYYADLGEDALVMWAHDLDTDAYAARLEAIAGRLDEPAGPHTTTAPEGTDDE